VIGEKVKKVKYRESSIITGLVATGYPEILVAAILKGLKPMWALGGGVPTSKEILKLCPPTTRAAESFKVLLG
jgi:hypothetical protein